MFTFWKKKAAGSKVSIVIPFYNCRYVDQAIESALAQTHADTEIVLVNDGSDAHVERIKPYLAHIRLIEKPNGGTASALNAGLRAAKGDYFAWLSADDLYEPERLSRQLHFMAEQRTPVSFANYDYIDAEGKVTARMAGMRFARTIDFYRTLPWGCPVNGCTVLLRMNLFDKVGRFDESLRYTKDYDMWMRIVLAGYEFAYFDESLVKYRIHAEMTTKTHEASIPAELERTRLKYHERLKAYIASMTGGNDA